MLSRITKEFLLDQRTLKAPSIKNWLDSAWFARDVCQDNRNRERAAIYAAKKGGWRYED